MIVNGVCFREVVVTPGIWSFNTRNATSQRTASLNEAILQLDFETVSCEAEKGSKAKGLLKEFLYTKLHCCRTTKKKVSKHLASLKDNKG